MIGVEGAAKEWFYLLDLEETNPIEKGKNTRLFNDIEAGENRKIECIITCQMGIRGATYWKQCHPVAYCPITTYSDYK